MAQKTTADESTDKGTEIAAMLCTSCGEDRDPNKDAWFGSDVRVCGLCNRRHKNGNSDYEISYEYPHTIYKNGKTKGKGSY